MIEAEQRQLEDLALDAAQADRRGGRDTLVVAETSNEQLDALNARAQAIRLQDGELGAASVPLTGRPYGLRAGDDDRRARAESSTRTSARSATASAAR